MINNIIKSTKEFKTNLKLVAYYYIKLLNLKITKESIYEDLDDHPYYPTLLSISDIFFSYDIPNYAYKIEASEFDQLKTPFLAYVEIKKNLKDFILIAKMDTKTISFLYETNKEEFITKEEFFRQYQGIIWVAYPNEESGEIDYDKKLKKQNKIKFKKSLLITSGFLVYIIALSKNIDSNNFILYSIISLIKLIGLAIAILLLIYEIDKKNEFISGLCSISGKKEEEKCTAVINSKASKILGISWSEIGFFYFSATTLFLLVPSLSFSNKIFWLGIGNLLTIPYVPFSIFYQWRIVKEWCIFCLTVLAILIIELLYFIFVMWPKIAIPTTSSSVLLIILACLFTPMIIWYALKNIFINNKNFNSLIKAYKQLQNNPEFFNVQLKQQKKVIDGWQHLGILIGDVNAENSIIKICNTFCSYCDESHKHLKYILKNKKEYNIRIIYVIPNIEHKAAYAIKHLLAIAEMGDQAYTIKALDDWYQASIKNYTEFATKYPVKKENLEAQEMKLNYMSSWCLEAEIRHTPTFFINGYQMPKNYKIGQIKYAI